MSTIPLASFVGESRSPSSCFPSRTHRVAAEIRLITKRPDTRTSSSAEAVPTSLTHGWNVPTRDIPVGDKSHATSISNEISDTLPPANRSHDSVSESTSRPFTTSPTTASVASARARSSTISASRSRTKLPTASTPLAECPSSHPTTNGTVDALTASAWLATSADTRSRMLRPTGDCAAGCDSIEKGSSPDSVTGDGPNPTRDCSPITDSGLEANASRSASDSPTEAGNGFPRWSASAAFESSSRTRSRRSAQAVFSTRGAARPCPAMYASVTGPTTTLTLGGGTGAPAAAITSGPRSTSDEREPSAEWIPLSNRIPAPPFLKNRDCLAASTVGYNGNISRSSFASDLRHDSVCRIECRLELSVSASSGNSRYKK